MKFRRWPHGIVTLLLLCVAVLLLVSVEGGSSTRATAERPTSSFSGFDTSAPPGPGTRLGRHHHRGSASPGATGPTSPPQAGPGASAGEPGAPGAAPARDDDEAATGSDGAFAVGGHGPDAGQLSMNPFNFRLGLINGTVVKPDARDWAARTVATGPLLLFLPATGHVPDNYRKFLTVAAESGYHVLGLDFWNRGDAVANICGVDARCYTQVQRNRFNGTRPSEFSKVDEANSVLSRLQAALDYLTVHDPDGGWGQYTHDEQIDWDNIVVSGHSQGGGEAAYIAHKFRVMGQITFSSPIITDKDHAASWLKTKGKTPTSVMYAFDDSHDEFYPRIIHSWRELHLPGRVLTARVPVPTASDPAHQLVSNRELGNPRLAHLRSVIDFTPVNKKGVPVFEPVWKWMLNQVYKDPESIEATAGGQ